MPELPKLTTIVYLVESAKRYTTGSLPDIQHQSLPMPFPGPEGLRVAFLYCPSAIIESGRGLQLRPPRYIAFFMAETGAFDELKLFAPEEWGLSAPEEGWIGSYLTPAERMDPEFLTKLIRLWQRYDTILPSFAIAKTDVSAEAKRAAKQFTTMFEDVAESVLIPYYRAVGKEFFSWLNLVGA
jgi:hypothetical protein